MLEEVLNEYGKRIVDALRKSMASKKLNNTGKTSRSIRYEVTGKGENLSLVIYGEENLLVLNDGAKAIKRKTTGKFIAEITKWAQTKLNLPIEEAKGLAYGYLNNRLGKGKGGLTTDSQGNYLVPNKFNSGGVLSDTLNQRLLVEISADISNSYESVIVESFTKFIKQDAGNS